MINIVQEYLSHYHTILCSISVHLRANYKFLLPSFICCLLVPSANKPEIISFFFHIYSFEMGKIKIWLQNISPILYNFWKHCTLIETLKRTSIQRNVYFRALLERARGDGGKSMPEFFVFFCQVFFNLSLPPPPPPQLCVLADSANQQSLLCWCDNGK